MAKIRHPNNYEEGKLYTIAGGDDKPTVASVSAVGMRPSQVQANVSEKGRSVTAFGGFQRHQDFDFQTAARAAVENGYAKLHAGDQI